LSFFYLAQYRDGGHVFQFQPDSTTTFHGVDLVNSENKSTDSTNPKKIALSNVEVLIAAGKFGIAPLKSLATRKFHQCLDAHWNSAGFPEIIRESMGLSPSHLQDLTLVIARVIAEHILDLIHHPAIVWFLDSFGSHVVSLLISSEWIQRPDEEDQFQKLVRQWKNCRNCSAAFHTEFKNIL
jgi:hypothetical protein